MDTSKEHKWPLLVGGFIINFGALEMTTFQWITALSTGLSVRDRAIDMPLSKRIALVRELITHSSLRDDRKLKAIELWDEAAQLSSIRNKLAHSPLCQNPNGSDEWGFVDVKRMKGIGPYEIEPLHYIEIAQAGSKLAKINDQLLWQFSADLKSAAASKAA